MQIMNTQAEYVRSKCFEVTVTYKKTFWQFLFSRQNYQFTFQFTYKNKTLRISPNQVINLNGINPKKLDLRFSSLHKISRKHIDPFKEIVVYE